MKYLINANKSVSKKEIRKSKKIIDEQIRRIKKYQKGYSKPLNPEIYINKINNIRFQICFVLQLIDREIIIKEDNKELEAAIYILFDKLKASLSKQIQKEKAIDNRKLHHLKISA